MTSLFKFLCRLAYAIAVVVTIPLFPLVVTGVFLSEYSGETGWFTWIAIGLMFWGLLAVAPLLFLTHGIKWILTGSGWRFLA